MAALPSDGTHAAAQQARGGVARRIAKRILVRLVLVASIAPVFLLGPALARAPLKLLHELAVRRPLALDGGAGFAADGHAAIAVDDPAGIAVAARAGQKHPHAHHPHLPGRVRGLHIVHSSATSARLVWHAAHRGRYPLEGYRVWRDGLVVGQTPTHTYSLRLGDARVHVLAVAAVDVQGHLGPRTSVLIGAKLPGSTSASHTLPSHPSSASQSLTHGLAPGSGQTPHTPAVHGPPLPPAQLAAERVTDTSATLAWQPGSVSSGTLVGYMLYENGEPEEVVHGQSVTIALASLRTYTFTVRTLASSGELSEPAPELTVVTTHTPPSVPGELSVSEVTEQSFTLHWSPATPVSGQIVGYRVFRDGLPVGEVAAPEMTLADLYPSTTYEITVVAVDSLGGISAPTAPLAVRTLDPTPTHGDVQAYLLASTDESFEDLQAHYQQIGVVYPTYFECGAEAAVLGHDDALVSEWAHARKIEVMPRLNCQNPNDETAILTNLTLREKFIEKLAALANEFSYNGWQIDFEGAPPSDREPFTAFIAQLAAVLHRQGDKVSTVVTAKTSNVKTGRAAMYDDEALSAVSDYIFVLDWGIHWTTSAPGPLDEMPWFKKVAEYIATMPNLNKFVLGMPMYGIDWKGAGGSANPGTPLEYSEVMALAAAHNATPEWSATAEDPWFKYTDSEGNEHTVWFTNERSIAARVALAETLHLHVGLWHLGAEDQTIWELPGLGG
jgi:spore germination protein YaaH